MREIASARRTAGLAQAQLANALSWSQSEYSRFERQVYPDAISVVDIASAASLRGLELRVTSTPPGNLCVTGGTRR